MKKLVLTLVILLAFAPGGMAQQGGFAPQGAEWYFNVSSFMNSPITYYRMAVEGDTLIQGHMCSIITRPFFGGNGDAQYVYEENRKVYWYNQTLQAFTTLYDFDAEVGESWICEVDSCSFEIQVQSIEEETWEGHTYRVQHVYAIGEDEYNSFFNTGEGTIIEGIGEISGLFPYSGACTGAIYCGSSIEYLRCYLVDGEMLYHEGSYNCDQQSFCWDGTVAEAYAGGDGTAENPYQIATSEQLALLAYETNNGIGSDAYYELVANINLQRCEGGTIQWVSIGTATNMFMGHFNGNGYNILSLNQFIGDGDLQPVGGLFGYTDHAVISNVRLVQCSIRGNGQYVGGLVGYAGLSNISNCSITQSSVKTEAGVAGGLVGCADMPFGTGFYPTDIELSYLTNCLTDVATWIEGSDCAGGIVGKVNKNDGRNPWVIADCRVWDDGYTAGFSVTSDGDAGGIVGWFRNGSISGCLNQFVVTGGNPGTGGIAGTADFVTIKNCINQGEISGGFATGGIVGYGDGNTNVTSLDIIDCVNEGSVTCHDMGQHAFVGGIVGLWGSKIIRCVNKGDVMGIVKSSGFVGGIVGDCVGIVANCYNRGNVTATVDDSVVNPELLFVGGISATPDPTIYNVYNTGVVTGPELPASVIHDYGNIIGRGLEDSHYLNAYWLDDDDLSACGNVNEPELHGSTAFVQGATSTTWTLNDAQYGTTDLLEALNFGAAVVLDSVPEYPYLTTWVADTENTNDGYPVMGNLPDPGATFQSGDLLYSIISNDPPHVSVVGHVNGENAQGELIIPETVNYEGVTYTVTKIGYEAFYQCSGLTGNLVIPSTVDTIMTRAFKNCSGFTGDLVIPNSVRHLGGGAFEWCYGFDGMLVLPEAIPAIYSYTFQGCTGLTGTLNIPSTVTSIGPAAFGYCTGFTGTLVIPESVTELSTPVPPVNGIRGAFEECSGFTGLVLPESLRIIGGGSGGGCFAYCTGLTGELVIPNKVKVIGHSAFYNCTGLTGELHLPDSLQNIGYEAFALCSGLTGRLVFPDALETIDNEAFAGCSGFSDVDLHHQVFYQNNFGNAVFAYWSMESLELPEGWTTTGKYTFKGCGNLRTVHLPESLTFVDGSSFSECTSLSEINIPEGVTEIGIGAFSKCSSLTHIELPVSLRTLGGQSFADCTSLSGILVVPDLVQRIEMMTFRSCNQLDCIVLGDSINYIAEPAFQDTELDSLVIKAMTPPELRRMTTQGAWHFPDDLSIVVPCGTLEAYQNSEDWTDFTNITEDCGSGLIEFQGSEWYYEIQNENGSITYQHLEYVADTTINHKDVMIIIRTNTLYDKGEHNEVTREYVYREDQLVYWWNKDLQEFTVLYDLGAQEGDSWVIKVGTETLTMHVDAVGYNYYGEQLFKMLYVSDDQDLFSGTIVSGIGHLSSFFPERLMTRGKRYGVNGLRCYWRFGNLLFTVNRGDCDAIYAELHIGLDEPTAIPFAIYPNPTNGVLTIQHSALTTSNASHFNIPNSSFRITNLMGQTVLTGSLTAETQQIDVSGLPQGMYFISVGEGTRKFVVR